MSTLNLNKLVIEALENLCYPVEYGWYDKEINDTHITFFQYNEVPVEHSDDEEEIIAHYVQVDLWSKENTEQLKKDVKAALKESDFIYQDSNDQFETDTGIYHKAMRFYIAEYL